MSQTIATAVSQRLYEGIRYSGAGATAVIRHLSRSIGPAPVVNPPTVETPSVKADAAAGATTISIAAGSADGQLVVGDQIIIGSVPYVVQANTAALPLASGPGFASVPIQPALMTPVTAGTPVTFSFAADESVYVSPGAVPLGITNGSSILAGDLMVKISSWNLSTAPTPDDVLLLNGQTYAIVSVTPIFAAGAVAGFTLQARNA